MNTKFCSISILLHLCALLGYSQTVTKIAAEQVGQTIKVSYNLETKFPCFISLFYSADKGKNWQGPLKKVIGDVGEKITSGDKIINWDVLEEIEQLKSSDVVFRVEVRTMHVKEVEKERQISRSADLNKDRNESGTLINPVKSEEADIFTAGLGFGQDLGGIGANLTYYATNRLGFQGGIGYALAGIGFNAGVKYRFLKGSTLSRRTPFFTAIYGYNAAIKISNLHEKDTLFYGPSLGFGFDSKALGTSHTYWSFAIYYPFRSSEVSNYMEDLKKNYGVVFKNDLYPITLSISYKMIIR